MSVSLKSTGAGEFGSGSDCARDGKIARKITTHTPDKPDNKRDFLLNIVFYSFKC
jgi:hypothetical protein